MCKDLKHLLYYRFNTGAVGKGEILWFVTPLVNILTNQDFPRGDPPRKKILQD